MSKLADNLLVEPVSNKHIKILHENLRQSDIDEVKASSGPDILKSITRSVNISDESCAVSVDGELLFIVGVVKDSLLTRSGTPWLLGTDSISKHKQIFLKVTYRILKYFQSNYSELSNYVDVRNQTSIRWLDFLGFEFCDPEKHGYEEKEFMKFYWSIG